MAHESDPVLFYATSNAYGELSSWWMAEFSLDGARWPSAEHYFMAQKTTDRREREQIRRAPTPRRAKELGRAVRLRRGWDGMKFEVMLRACTAKFSQHPELRELLLSTGTRPLHEDSDDPWWGGGPNFPRGRDMLGRVLVRVRAALAEQDSPPG